MILGCIEAIRGDELLAEGTGIDHHIGVGACKVAKVLGEFVVSIESAGGCIHVSYLVLS